MDGRLDIDGLALEADTMPEPRGAIALKGVTEPVSLFRVGGPTDTLAR